jgi:Tfp pilus assembly protein PilO
MLVDNLTNIGHSTRNATSAVLIVIAAFAMYNWTVTPHTTRLSSAKAYESVVDALAKQNKIIATKIKVRRKKLDELRGQSAQLLSMLFTPDQAREFFSDIEVISEQTGCAVQSINLLTGQKKNEHEHLGIKTRSAELSVLGLYRDIARLIRRLHDRSQKVWLDSVELRTIDYSSEKIGCNLTITICETMDKDTL